MTNPGGASGAGAVSVTFRHPASAFIYQATTPKLRINGVDVPVPGWGTYQYPLAPGRHQLHAWVPYVLPRRAGKATVEVEVHPRQRVDIEYMAPTVTFASGSMGTPGQQKSTGFTAIMALNVLAVLAVVVACGAMLLGR